MPRRNHRETSLHKAICNYIKLQYPKVMFNSDQAGSNMSKAQAGIARVLRSHRGYPDLHIFQAKGKYHGLFLEIKAESPFKKGDGKLKAGDHLKEQQSVITSLNRRGYKSMFVWSLDQAKNEIDAYMKIR